MQKESLIRSERQRGPDVWELRWRELAGNGKRTHRRIVLGSVDRLVDEAAAHQAVSAYALTLTRAMPDPKRTSPRFPSWLSTTGSAS
jgi:hypothetical protein